MNTDDSHTNGRKTATTLDEHHLSRRLPPSYTYTYDGMGRLNGMGGSTSVSGVQYNAAGQMTAGLDTRTYNQMGQLTSISSGSLNVSYTYSATQNIGKISSATYNGEQVSYTYDTLNRLVAAKAGSTWGQGFNYDPFGNLTTKYVLPGTTGSVPTLSVVPDAATNHLGGVDANGNATGYGINYDLENRLITASGAQYTYDGQNKRIFSCTNSCASETYYFYAPSGKLIAQFTPVYTAPYRVQNQVQLAPATLVFQNGPTRAYFGSRLLGNEDRLGSRGKYFPYGEDNSSQNPPSDNVKFATYTRDSATGLDYADQRYYANSTARFTMPDPSSSASTTVPQSWNKYAYSSNDPINSNDPSGLCDVMLAGIRMAAAQDGDFEAYSTDMISVYAYSVGASPASGFLGKVSGIAQGIFDVASQMFGPNSSTTAAVVGLLLASEDDGPINVTTFSGGAQAFTKAVAFLNDNGGADIVARINNITYVSPGGSGSLYDNGHGQILTGNGLVDSLASLATFSGLSDAAQQAPECGHDFGCIMRHFSQLVSTRQGSACSSPAGVYQQDTTGFSRMLFSPPPRWGTNTDAFYWMDAYLNSVPTGLLPSVTMKFRPRPIE